MVWNYYENRGMMKNTHLIRTFTIYSLIAFALMGTVLSFVIYKHIKDDKLANIEEAAQVTVKAVVNNNLQRSDFSTQITSTKSTQISSSVIEAMSLYDVESITFVNKNKEVILSENSDFAGDQVQDSNYLDKVLNAEVSFAFSDSYKSTIANGTSEGEIVINLYEPIIYDGTVEGVCVMQIPYQSVIAHADMLLQIIALTISSGLFILFLLLIGVLYKTSKTMLKQNDELIEQKTEIKISYNKLDDSYKCTVLALSNAVDARDPYTAGHSMRVSKISLLISEEMKMTDEDSRILEYAALFHDIGKIGIPDDILNKREKLTDDEYNLIKNHPDIGVNILGEIAFLLNSLPLIKHHHERFDGKGYPSGIIGEEIPLCARIIAIADTYDAMTSDRPYRRGFSHAAAVQEILENKGAQFDGTLVDVFMKIEGRIKDLA